MADRAPQDCVYCCREFVERYPVALGVPAAAAQDDLGIVGGGEGARPGLRELAKRVRLPPGGAIAHHHEYLAAGVDHVTDTRVAPHDADLQHLLGRPVHGVHRAERWALHRTPPRFRPAAPESLASCHCIQSSPYTRHPISMATADEIFTRRMPSRRNHANSNG